MKKKPRKKNAAAAALARLRWSRVPKALRARMPRTALGRWKAGA